MTEEDIIKFIESVSGTHWVSYTPYWYPTLEDGTVCYTIYYIEDGKEVVSRPTYTADPTYYTHAADPYKNWIMYFTDPDFGPKLRELIKIRNDEY